MLKRCIKSRVNYDITQVNDRVNIGLLAIEKNTCNTVMKAIDDTARKTLSCILSICLCIGKLLD